MRILADLHGGDLDNAVARAEFREIKDKIILEVRQSALLLSALLMIPSQHSGEVGKVARTA